MQKKLKPRKVRLSDEVMDMMNTSTTGTTVRTATMLMRLLNIIVERMITEPNEISSLYQGLPESVKESIEKRDK